MWTDPENTVGPVLTVRENHSEERMSLKALAEKRFSEGKSEHKGTDDEWNHWEMSRFIDEAEAELADTYNYLEELRRRINEREGD